jgi:Ribbon-helix-helix protein, copG family
MTSPRLAFTLYAIMAKSISVKRKKPGRPATGTEPLYGVRIADELMGRIEKWAEENSASRSEAIRRLVEIGLKAKTPARPVSKPGQKLRAQELAAKAIEKIIDPSAPAEERAQRRHRLTKGPPEFRDDRVDLPKAKGK